MNKAEIERKWRRYENEMWKLGLDYYRKRLRELDLPKGRLLDLGCGPGQWGAAAAKEGMEVIGSDIKIKGTACTLLDIPNLTFIEASAEEIPFRNATFNVVLCELVFPYIDVQQSVREISRVLKPHGVIHAICHGPGYYLLKGINEAKRLEVKAMIKRLIVLGYTFFHHLLHFKKYYYETYQNEYRMRKVLNENGIILTRINRGGHPNIPEKTFLGLTTFFELTGEKADVLTHKFHHTNRMLSS
jgi:ubiquinone/menaquinone biosynthesis C-methylase UbiE